MEQKDFNRPIPAPRRLYPELRKTDYENVTINLINKNLNINSENIHISDQNNDKLPNNKVFLMNQLGDDSLSKNILTETNDLYGPNVNEQVDNEQNNSTPIPTPRKPQNNENELANEISENREPIIQITKYTGAIRKAPELPQKMYPNLISEQTRNQRYSITSEISTTSTNFGELRDQLHKGADLERCGSNLTINSSISGSMESGDSTKYKSPSPGNLLKTLGSTSKLLTESIGERVASKAKGAKHKLDKNLKSSSDALINLGTETTNRIKNASKQLGANFTLQKKDKRKSTSESLDFERPVTLPTNDAVINSISFSSPLYKKSTAQDKLNISDDHKDESYATPRNLKTKSPPSYDEVIASDIEQNFQRTNTTSQSLMLPKQLSRNTNLESKSSENIRDSFISLPMPTFPPPELPKEINEIEGIYGKVQIIQPPQRQKRRKNYEEINFRRPQNDEITNSMRVNITSEELFQLNDDAIQKERKESILLQEKIRIDETKAPHPQRSDSWQYYDEGNIESDDRSSPEPVYANHEATYGKLFEMATNGSDLLPSQQAQTEIVTKETTDCAISSEKLPVELIREFDPLDCAASLKDTSNQLLLLEQLLEDDTYGSIKRRNQDDDVSSECTSEMGAVKMDDKNRKSNTDVNENNVQIVHQNGQLSSNSSVDDKEAQIMAYLCRIDETPRDKTVVDLSRPSDNRSHWFVQDECEESPPSYSEAIGSDTKKSKRLINPKNVFNNVKIRVDALKRKASFKAQQKSADVKVALQMIPRAILSQLYVRHEGPLVRFPSGVVGDILKDMQHRRATLRDRQFQTYQDSDMKVLKECIPLECITTIQCVSNNRVTDNSTQFYCFEITVAIAKNNNNVQTMSTPNTIMTNQMSGNCKYLRETHLYGVGKESERGIWMQKLMESLTNNLPAKHTCNYYRAGWCYMKHSITSEWCGAWLVLKKQQRRLVFVSDITGNVEKLDLRKARCIVLKDSDDSINNLYVENGPTIMVDCPPYTLYLIMNVPRETKIWRHIICEVAHNNGFTLSDQQLTKFNVPVIVDKCINFVYIHGSMSEGIYRKSGSEQSILKLMASFRANAFNVEITRNEYNEHDVANVLKRFMRDLPERLLGKLSESFLCVSEIPAASEKIELYKDLLARLGVIERETLKKLIGHLSFISSLKEKNKMGIKNLTMIWGPSLMQCQSSESMTYSQKEANVLTDLILLYKNLFPLTVDEVKKEQEMMLYLQKYYAAAETMSNTVKKSGDLKMWIVLNPYPEQASEQEEKTQVNVTITPTITAYDICKELAGKMKLAAHEVTLYEVILNGNLERPLHSTTKVFDLIIQWSYWPEEDRKDNILMVKPLELLKEMQRAVKNLATITPCKELKFADHRTKSYKSLFCELRDGKIVIFKKDKAEKSTIIREIFLHSSTAYLGCENKREFPWSWAITFVDNTTNKQILRSRDVPFIGHVLAGTEWMDRTFWFASIWYFLYGDNILPPVELIIN